MSRRNGVQKPGDVAVCGTKGFFEPCLREVELRMENTVKLWTDVAPHWGHWADVAPHWGHWASWLVIKAVQCLWKRTGAQWNLELRIINLE